MRLIGLISLPLIALSPRTHAWLPMCPASSGPARGARAHDGRIEWQSKRDRRVDPSRANRTRPNSDTAGSRHSHGADHCAGDPARDYVGEDKIEAAFGPNFRVTVVVQVV